MQMHFIPSAADGFRKSFATILKHFTFGCRDFPMLRCFWCRLPQICLICGEGNIITCNNNIVPFWRFCSRWLLKTLWQKEKLFIKSNFSFCHNMFYFVQKWLLYFKRYSMFLAKLFQSPLLQICFMWEKVEQILFF